MQNESKKNETNNDSPLILIVDDETRNLQVIASLLKEKGYRLIMATDGEKAIAAAKECLPSLILLDVMMPKMDGFEVCRRLKKDLIASQIPIIFLTALVSTEDIVKGFQAGAVDYISKPFRAEELLARVSTHIQLKQLKYLLSVCSVCSCVNEEDGSWTKLEHYVHKKTGTHFSHGYCPKCYEKVAKEIEDLK